jgi:hypothetical protein
MGVLMKAFKSSWYSIIVVLVFALFQVACTDDSSGSDAGSRDADGSTGVDASDGGGQDGADTSGTDAGGDNTGADLPICDEVEIKAHSVSPNMLLVVDRSGSMDLPIHQGDTRTKMQDLKDAVDALLTAGEGKIRFGWMSYPDCTECMFDQCDPGIVSVDVGDDSISAVRQQLSKLTSKGGTPTGGSLENADDYYRLLADADHRDFVLLITDGIPTCPLGDGMAEFPEDAQLALDAVETLHEHGVDTFVIGLGEDLNNTSPELLDQMAEAGGWPRDGSPKYFAANSLNDLNDILDAIGGMVIECNLVLDAVPEFPAYLWVYFDDQAVPRDETGTDGWQYDPDRNAIDFYGSYCEKLGNGQVSNVEIEMGCKPPD